jgi:hypothetical protein
MNTTVVEVAGNPHHGDSCIQPARGLFYRNSGVFDLSGSLLKSGRIDLASVREIQATLGKDDLLLVVDLEDTWIRPFTSSTQRERVIDSVLSKAPFLITQKSIFYVAYSTAVVKVKEFAIDEMNVVVLNRDAAKSTIMAALDR